MSYLGRLLGGAGAAEAAIVFRRRDPHDRITRYDIAVENPDHVSHGVVRTELDGVTIADGAAPVPLSHDGGQHWVRVVLDHGGS